jgi:uncharacterized membrane protein
MGFQSHASMLPFAILGGLAWLAIVVGVVLLVVWAVRAFPGHRLMPSAPAAVESPLDTLARRFALGEMTPEEFERARDLLRGESPKS